MQITARTKNGENYFTAYIPYENSNRIIRYIIILRFNSITGDCKYYIQVNYLNGAEFLTQYFGRGKLKPEPDIQQFFRGLHYSDLSLIEKRIIKIEKEIQEGC